MRTSLLVLLLAGCTPDTATPTEPTVSITPHDPDTTRDLQVFIVTQSIDEDSDTLEYLYAWEVDGVVQEDQATGQLAATKTAKGETWVVRVQATDGENISSTAMGLTIIINSPPSAELSLGPVAPLSSDDLVAEIAITDVDEDETSATLSWTKNGEATDYTDATLPAEATLKGETWAITVTPTDTEDEGESATAEVTVGNQSPVIDSLSLSPEEIYEDTEVEALATVRDEDGDELSLSYQWMVDGTEVLSGESDTLTGEFFDKGQEISVTATLTDGSTAGDPLSTEGVRVLNTAPTVREVLISPETAVAGDSLSCSYSFEDADGDEDQSTQTWSLNGSDVEAPEDLISGDEVVCTLIPYDGEEEGEEASDAITIGNTPPGAPQVRIDPASPVEGADALLCEIETDSEDTDGDTIHYTMSWTVDGTAFTDTETTTWDDDTVPSDAPLEDEEWVCAAVPDDGVDLGDAGEDEVTIMGPDVVTDFSIEDVNKTSDSYGSPVSPRDMLEQVSGWYFGHAT